MDNGYNKFNENKIVIYKTNYNTRPNLRYKENIINDFKHSYWYFDNFDIYYKKENRFEVFLVYGCVDNDNINIVRISDKKLIKSLKGHTEVIYIVKHFYNEKNNKNYLLSADYSKIIFVWDLNQYITIHIINTNYSSYINNLIMFFDKNYIITSTDGCNNNVDYIKIYSLINAKLIMNFKQNFRNETLYLLIWKYNNKYHLIELCYQNIFIYLF